MLWTDCLSDRLSVKPWMPSRSDCQGWVFSSRVWSNCLCGTLGLVMRFNNHNWCWQSVCDPPQANSRTSGDKDCNDCLVKTRKNWINRLQQSTSESWREMRGHLSSRKNWFFLCFVVDGYISLYVVTLNSSTHPKHSQLMRLSLRISVTAVSTSYHLRPCSECSFLIHFNEALYLCNRGPDAEAPAKKPK